MLGLSLTAMQYIADDREVTAQLACVVMISIVFVHSTSC